MGLVPAETENSKSVSTSSAGKDAADHSTTPKMAYGSVSASEDFANLGSMAEFDKEHHLTRLNDLLQTRFREKKFELPVKAVIQQMYLGAVYDFDKDECFGLPLPDLRATMEEAAPDTVPVPTYEAFQVARRAAQIRASIMRWQKADHLR
jgi:hypothetical protein